MCERYQNDADNVLSMLLLYCPSYLNFRPSLLKIKLARPRWRERMGPFSLKLHR